MQKLIFSLGFLLLVIGLLFLSAGSIIQNDVDSFVSASERADGEIISIERERDYSIWRDNTSAIVRFSDGGRNYTFKSQYYADHMKVGDNIAVYYQGDNPNNARVIDGDELMSNVILGIGAALSIFGLIAWGISMGMRLMLWRKSKEAENEERGDDLSPTPPPQSQNP